MSDRQRIHMMSSLSSSKFSSIGSKKPNAFQSLPEQLLQGLISFGYDPPKHLKADHLEYLFKDGSHFVKLFMRNGKPENITTPDEISKYELLRDQGLLLYGDALQNSVERRRAFETAYSNAKNQQVLKIRELQKEIEEAKTDVSELKRKNEMISRLIQSKQQFHVSKQIVGLQTRRELENLKIATQVARKRLTDKLELLKEIKEKAIDSSLEQYEKKQKENFDNPLQKFVHNEDHLHHQIRDIMEAYLPNLIMEAGGYSCSKIDVNGRRLEKIVQKHVDNSQRLMASIAYEKARRFKLNLKILMEETAIQALIPCMAKASRQKLNSTNNNTRIYEKGLEKRIGVNEIELENDCIEVTIKIHKDALRAINRKFNEQLESKQRAKKRLLWITSHLLEILQNQKVRFQVVRTIINKKIDHFVNLDVFLTEFARRLSAFNFETENVKGSMFTHEGRILHEICEQLGYTIKTNPPQTLECILKDVSHRNLAAIKYRKTEQRKTVMHLSTKLAHFKKNVEQLRFSTTPSTTNRNLKDSISKKAIDLRAIQEGHDSIQKSLDQKQTFLQEMKTALENL